MGNSTATYTVVGMTCNGCVNKVTNAVEEVAGVDDIDVDVATGTLEVPATSTTRPSAAPSRRPGTRSPGEPTPLAASWRSQGPCRPARSR